jgi:bile acid-coenzyme A ligase
VLATGEVSEIWMRLHSEVQPFRYVGTETPAPILGGYRTYGDMGSVDDDGYLYIADRRQDMIVTGGFNVFPAEVEAALSEHPGLADSVVIGLPDVEWGHRVHAVVQPADPPTEDEIRAFCRARLSGPNVPKAIEIVARLPRTTAGKINRSALVAARSPSQAG